MDAAHRRYRTRTAIFMGTYVALNLGAIFGIFDSTEPPGTWFLALAIAGPVAGHIWATLALMQEVDEFVRGVMARRFILASGAAMALFSAWGFLESYADVTPHMPGWMIYCLFWFFNALATPFVRTTR